MRSSKLQVKTTKCEIYWAVVMIMDMGDEFSIVLLVFQALFVSL